MMKRVRKLLKNPRFSKVVSNFLSLFLLQGANYILPLITIPYLARVLGPEQYGLFAMANALNFYFQIVTDYGFGLSATREVSVYRKNAGRINSIFSSVMLIKGVLTVASFAVLTAVVLLVPRFRADMPVYLLTFGNIVGLALFPVWLFQGLERMKYITYFNLAAKAVITVLIFAVVREQNHLIRLVLLYSVGSIATGVVSVFWAVSHFKVRFVLPAWKEIRRQLEEGWHVFISTVSVVIYNSSPTFILGLFTNNTVVGYYSGALKIKGAFDGLMNPFYQALYPYVSSLAARSRAKAQEFIRKEVLVIGGMGFILFLGLFFGSDILTRLLLGKAFTESAFILKILSPASFFVVFGFILTVQTLLSFGLKKAYSKIYLITSLAGMTGALLFTGLFQAAGTAMNLVLIEFLVFVLTSIVLYRKGLVLPFKKKTAGN